MPSEILKHIETIIISVLTAAGTTFLIIYIKNRKMRLIEQITVYDDRIRIIDSIVMNSLLSFIMAIVIADADIGNNYKLPIIIIVGTGIMFFTYGHLRFHKSFLIDTLRSKQTKLPLILVALFIFGFWVSILWFIFRFGESSTHISRILIFPFYIILFTLRLYFKWGTTRSYKKIIVFTIDGSRYESMELLNLDDHIAIYEKETDKRIIIPSHQIKAIEYEYEKTTIADFIDEEH